MQTLRIAVVLACALAAPACQTVNPTPPGQLKNAVVPPPGKAKKLFVPTALPAEKSFWI